MFEDVMWCDCGKRFLECMFYVFFELWSGSEFS